MLQRTVLPVPVLALAITSFPSRTFWNVFTCTGNKYFIPLAKTEEFKIHLVHFFIFITIVPSDGLKTSASNLERIKTHLEAFQ